MGGYGVYAVDTVLSNEIWFVAGMILFLCSDYLYNVKRCVGLVIVAAFVAASIVVNYKGNNNGYISFALGLMACIGFILLFSTIRKENAMASLLAEYTMPIFLMHTIFAAPIRVILLKIGVHNAVAHAVIGLSISFAGPIIAAEIMKRFRWMEFFIYPGKYIKMR